ncbi:MAG: glycosyltransferase [Sphingobium sp.]|nr:glycosyltransferase [Sphingobium sp.]
MRVMLFLKGFGPGGVERIALRLGDGLRRTGCDLTVIVAAATGPMDNPLGQACLVAQPWPVIGMRWPLLRLAYRLWREIRRAPPAILFCPGNISPIFKTTKIKSQWIATIGPFSKDVYAGLGFREKLLMFINKYL